jgi:hypothetical protein
MAARVTAKCGLCGEVGHRADNERHGGRASKASALNDDPPPAVAKVRLRLAVVGSAHTRSSRTIAPKRLSTEERAVAASIDADRDLALAQRLRPKTRGECLDGPRPCPYVSCWHHMYLDVEPSGGLKLNYPDKDPADMADSCSLDLADRGGMTLEGVGDILGITKERARQIEVRGLAKAKVRGEELGPMPEAPAGYEAAG